MHRDMTQKTHTPYSVFDASRFLQTALQSLHEMLRPAGRIPRIEKAFIHRLFPHAGRIRGL
jgi:hypothetical protein